MNNMLFELVAQMPEGTNKYTVKSARCNYKTNSVTRGYFTIEVCDADKVNYEIGQGFNLENPDAKNFANKLFFSPLIRCLGIKGVESLPELAERINAAKNFEIEVTCSRYCNDYKDASGSVVHKEGYNYTLK